MKEAHLIINNKYMEIAKMIAINKDLTQRMEQKEMEKAREFKLEQDRLGQQRKKSHDDRQHCHSKGTMPY